MNTKFFLYASCVFVMSFSSPSMAIAPVPLINQPLVPASTAPGNAEFTLTVIGSNFATGAALEWNGSPRTTQVLSASRLQATIPASDIATAQTAEVTVRNPGSESIPSNVVFFPITKPSASVPLARVEYSAPNGNIQVVTADFNRDGKVDLASADWDPGSLAIWSGHGDGTFDKNYTRYSVCGAHALVSGDFNHDTLIDLAVAARGCRQVVIFLGNGDGTFRQNQSISTAGTPYSIVSADFNRDGQLDLVVPNESGHGISTLLGNGNGTFKSPIEFRIPGASSVYYGAPADFNNDGMLDLAVTDQTAVLILLGNGDGTFSSFLSREAVPGAFFIISADFNGDNQSDLAVSDVQTGGVSVLLGRGDGTFDTDAKYATPGNSAALASADMNGDNLLDLISTNYVGASVSVLLGRGNGKFATTINYPAVSGARGLCVADFNRDGRFDMAVGNQGQSSISVFLQLPATGPWLLPLDDINGDGTPEIAVVAGAVGKTIATVKDAANGDLVSDFAFSANLRPVDVEAMDAFGFGSGLVRNLVLLGDGPPTAETRDVVTGDLIGSVAFNPKFSPVDLTVLPDQDGNGIPELGMLGKGSTRVEIRDAVTGDLVNNLGFAPRFDPLQVIALPDLNANGSAEVGVVLSKADETDRIVVKDTVTDEKLETVGTWWKGEYDLLQALPVTDAAGDATGNVAMLLHDPATGNILVRIADAASNTTAAAVRGYNRSFAPVKLAQVADFNGNGFDEYALLARNPDTGQVTAELRDDSGGVSRMWFSSDCTPIDLASIADINNNGAQELVMLGRCGVEGTLRATVKDAKTGETLNRMRF